MKSARQIVAYVNIKKEIKNKIPIQGYSNFIGKEREKMVHLVLDEMKKEMEIIDFIETGKLSYADVMEGIDIYIVFINGSAYKTARLSVTGPRWMRKHAKKHPEVPVIAVDIKDPPEKIRRKIRKILT